MLTEFTLKVPPATATMTVLDNLRATHLGNAQSLTLGTAAQDGGSTGDGVVVYGFAVDYPLFNSAFPQSKGSAAFSSAAANGHADVTKSLASIGAQ